MSVYDKSSNWFNGMEKGFVVMKRPVPPGVRLGEDEWCISMNVTGTKLGRPGSG